MNGKRSENLAVAVVRDARLDDCPLRGVAIPAVRLHHYWSADAALDAHRPASGKPAQHCGVYVLDFRAGATRENVEGLRSIQLADPDAKVLVVAREDDPHAMAAAVRYSAEGRQASFLLAPNSGAEASGIVANLLHHANINLSRRSEAERMKSELSQLHFRAAELSSQLHSAIHAAEHDALTGVKNRAGFTKELNARLNQETQDQVIILVDLDRFKAVNDTLGHSAGDELIRALCHAVAVGLPGQALLGRLGGDEFGIVVEGETGRSVEGLCADLLRIFARPRRVQSHEVQISASIGVARQRPGEKMGSLIRRADLALYAAKREGRNQVRTYDEALEREVGARMRIETNLEQAIGSSQFGLVYQPIVASEGGAIVGFEALVRWDSPVLGPVSPADFIPIAEETGGIIKLGDWILRRALKDSRRWEDQYISINLSATQFRRHDIAERVLAYAKDAEVSPHRIQIELTETAIIEDVEMAARHLSLLRNAGVRIALDDFGTGYSGLTYLNQFDIDCIKIDKSFVDGVALDHQSAIIVASVAKLARSLGMTVVAEGVESSDQFLALSLAGCAAQQGYYFNRPMDAAAAEQLVAGVRSDGPVETHSLEASPEPVRAAV